MRRQSPRPASDSLNECLHGGIPKPLFGKLVGDITAELADGALAQGVQAVRFERAFPCQTDARERVAEGK